MPFPLQINARHFRLSEPLENEIRKRAAKLESYFHRIVRGRVLIEAPLQHHYRNGGPYQVRLTFTVPGSELVATGRSDKDIYTASHDAFDAMRRQLEEYARQRRGAVKNHEEPLLEGRVTKLFRSESYGFLETPDGREIYFHGNSVLDPGFSHLTIGTAVRFAEEQGEEGPQASTVHVRIPTDQRAGKKGLFILRLSVLKGVNARRTHDRIAMHQVGKRPLRSRGL